MHFDVKLLNLNEIPMLLFSTASTKWSKNPIRDFNEMAVVVQKHGKPHFGKQIADMPTCYSTEDYGNFII